MTSDWLRDTRSVNGGREGGREKEGGDREEEGRNLEKEKRDFILY